MATFEKDGAGGSGEEVSAEFLRKLDSLKKKDNTGTASQKPTRKQEEDQPPAELMRKLEALKKGAGAAPSSSPSQSKSDDLNVSPELLRKLEVVQKGGSIKTGDIDKPSQTDVSPELLRKLNAIATRKGTGDQPLVQPSQSSPPSAAQLDSAHASSPPGAQGAFVGEGAIEKAMELMRQLPINDQNVELMMQVVKSTLESFNINIDGIIADAAKRRRELEHRIQGLQQEVASFEEEIRKRTGTIHGLRRQYEEITLVGDRLLTGQKRARQGNPEIGSHLTDSELWGADDEETSAALDALLPGASPRE